MSIYQTDPESAPDSEFEPGDLHHLVIGNTGRMLDPRRTPVTILDLHLDTGFVVLRVDAFKDAGATWEIPIEAVDHYQFALGSHRASDEAIDEFRDIVERLGRPLLMEPDLNDRRETEGWIGELTARADTWLGVHSRFLASQRPLPDPATRRGDELLMADLESFMRDRGLWEMDQAFTRQFVCHPYAGEIVKGHRIVIAELGLAAYAGTIVRDPATFEGAWSRKHRATHVCTRLAFLRALFVQLGQERVLLWRGISADGPPDAGRRYTLVSMTFDEAVARSHLAGDSERRRRLLISARVPVSRLLMTYLETRAMNENYLEAERYSLRRREPEPGIDPEARTRAKTTAHEHTEGREVKSPRRRLGSPRTTWPASSRTTCASTTVGSSWAVSH